MSSFCKALLQNSPIEKLEEILKADDVCLDCIDHETPLRCVINICITVTGFRCDFFKLLINRIDEDCEDRSILCTAIRLGATAKEVESLVKQGASLNACDYHYTPLHCATSKNVRLTSHLVKFLIKNGTYLEDIDSDEEEADDIVYLLKYPEQLTPLQRALKKCNYEVDAIKVLLDLPGNDALDDNGYTLLHFAVLNQHCKIDVIKMLIKRGISPNTKDAEGKSALFLAKQNKNLEPSIIELLVKYSKIFI